MKPQLYQVFRTYWQRPLLDCLTVVLLLLLVWIYCMPGNYGTGKPVAPHRPFPSQHGNLNTADSEILDPASGFSLWAETLSRAKSIRTLNIRKDSDGPLPDLTAFENLESVSLSGKFTQADIEQLAELEKLVSFEMLEISLMELPKGAFTKLGKKIHYLETTNHALLSHKEELIELTSLESLYLQELQGDENFNEIVEAIALIPNLRTLVLKSQRQVHTIKKLLPLKNHPALRDVYVQLDLLPRSERVEINNVSSLRLLPLTYPSRIFIALKLAQVVSLLVSILLGIQLKSHFTSPYAQTVPGYGKAHQLAAILIFFCVSAMALFGLIVHGLPVLPALALVYWIPGCIAVIVLASLSGRKWMPFVAAPLGIVVITPLSLSSFILKVFPSDCLWFLQGNMHKTTIAFLAVEFLSLVYLFVKLSTVHRTVNEKFPVLPALELKTILSQQWAQGASKNPFFRMFDKSMTDLSHHQNSTWRVIQLWRKGNPFRPGLFILIFVPFLFLFTVVFGALAQGVPSGISTQAMKMAMWGGLSQIVGIGLILPFISWFQRKKYLESASLRPVERKSFVKQLFLALAVDHWVAWLAGIAVLVYFLIYPVNGDIFETLAFAPTLPATAIWLFGAGTAVFACKNDWVVALTGPILAVLPLVGLIILALIVDGNSVPERQQLQIVTYASLAMIPAGALLVNRMYRRTLNREWG